MKNLKQKGKNMKNVQKRCLTILLFTLFSSLLIAQTMQIRGKVLSTSGEKLIGANVQIKTLAIGCVTNLEGEFDLEVPSKFVNSNEVILSSSYIGFKEKNETITLSGGILEIDFTLEEDIFESETVVVTGIASKTSKAVAEVAVARIDAKDLTEKQNYQGLSQLIAGKIAGVQVQTNSGNVGGGWRFHMRSGGGLNGNGQPVIYVDGIRVVNEEISGFTPGSQKVSTLAGLNPEDIENIEILKGAAASAMYGTDGSNGVVLITTKSGKGAIKEGQSFRINYKHVYGSNTQRLVYDEDKYLRAKGFNEILDEGGLIRENTVNLTGGSDQFRYYVAYSKRYEEGLLPFQNYMDRNSAKVNLTMYPNNKLSVKLNSNYVWSKGQRAPNEWSWQSWFGNYLAWDKPYKDAEAIKKVKYAHEPTQFLGSVNVSYTPIKNLEIQGGVGIDFNERDEEVHLPKNYDGFYAGWRGLYNNTYKQYTYNLNARYNFSILKDRIKINPVIGTQIIETNSTNHALDAYKFENPAVYIIDAGEENYRIEDNKFHWKKAGIFFENSISLDDIYYMNLGIRKDYASAIGDKAPSIIYPTAGLSIRADRLDFLNLPSAVNLLKLRIAYGESGQLPSLTAGLPLTWTSVVGGGISGAVIQAAGNPAIEPERIKELEFGIDLELFNMFSAELTGYFTTAENSIINLYPAPSSGMAYFPFPFNVGSKEGKGFESLFQFILLRSADYDLNVSFIYNYQENEITNLGDKEEQAAATYHILKIGYPAFEFYQYRALGAEFDVNGNYTGVKFSDEKVPLGNPTPAHTGSFSVNFRFLKNFNFYGLVEYVAGNKVYGETVKIMAENKVYRPDLEYRAALGLLNDDFIQDNGLTHIVKLTPGTDEYVAAAEEYATNYDPSARANYIVDGDYVVIREMSLSYTATDLIKKYLGNDLLSEFVMGVSVRNLAKWSKYDLDPEVNYYSRTGAIGLDSMTLPQPRTFNFWVKLGL